MVYPSRQTRTSEDLMVLLALTEERRNRERGSVLPYKSPVRRRLFEALLNLGGLGVCALLEAIPADLVLRVHDRVFRALGGGGVPFDGQSPALGEARELAARVERLSGKAPALLAVISHPPVVGEGSHLNFELVRHTMLGLRAARGKPCRPRLVVAVDSFALDNIPLLQEGLYAGCMGNYHIGLDRLAKARARLSSLVVGRSDWSRMPWRLIRQLSDGGEIGIVLAGGIPSTTRTLYMAREWLAAERRAAGANDPSAVLAGLRREGSFREFEQGGWAHASAWRVIDAWFSARLSGLGPGIGGERPDVDGGRLTAAGRAAAGAYLAAIGARSPEASLARLSREIGRETTFRARFFRSVLARAGARRPMVLLPVTHSLRPAGVAFKAPWAWLEPSAGGVKVLRPGTGAPEVLEPEAFAEEFVGGNFA